MQKYARLRCCHQSAWIDLRQTFNKYRGVSRLHNTRFQLRRFAQGTLLWLWRAAFSCCWIGLAPGASATSLSLFVGTSTVPVVARRSSGSSALCRARFPMMDRELCRAMGYGNRRNDDSQCFMKGRDCSQPMENARVVHQRWMDSRREWLAEGE